MIIKLVLSALVLWIIGLELYLLHCKIHLEYRILSTLLKIVTLILMSFFLIEGTNYNRDSGGLVIHSLSLK
jgi:hypothetical protein